MVNWLDYNVKLALLYGAGTWVALNWWWAFPYISWQSASYNG